MNILLVEPYLTGSHAQWAFGYKCFSRFNVEILSLKGQFWKWRMHGGAVTLARKFNSLAFRPDLILATDMLDLTTFLSLTRPHTGNIPVALYFHENQFAYPWSEQDRDVAQQRDKHYGFINYASALAADAVFFNSHYNRDTFLQALHPFLKHFPDHNELNSIAEISKKSVVLPLGLDLKRFDELKCDPTSDAPLVLWNHRWEHDKNPQDFFAALNILNDRGVRFNLVLLGENFRNSPIEFAEARALYGPRMLHFGYAASFAEYAGWLWQSDVLPVTSLHDFFGVAVVEALYCGCFPLLPNRLAYPEIVPTSQWPHCYYESFEELVVKLEIILKQGRAEPNLQTTVTDLDWTIMAPRYDETFAKLTNGY